jgi:hypothetical protein
MHGPAGALRVVYRPARARRQSQDGALLPPALNASRVWARFCVASFSPPCARRSVCRGQPFVQPIRRPRARLARLRSEPLFRRLPVAPAPRVRRHELLVGRAPRHALASRFRVGQRGQFVLRAGLLLRPGARRLPDPPAQARRGTFPAAPFSPAQSLPAAPEDRGPSSVSFRLSRVLLPAWWAAGPPVIAWINRDPRASHLPQYRASCRSKVAATGL